MPDHALHHRLGYRVSRLARIMQSQVEAILATDGLTRMMWLVLTGVGEDGIRSPSDMAAYIGITRPATSRLLRRMETLGHIARSGDDADGRAVTLALTDRGAEVLRRCRPQVDAVTARLTAKIDPATLSILLDALGRLAEGEADGFSSL